VILIYSVDEILSSQGQTHSPIQEIKASNFAVTDVVFSPDGQSLANGSVDRTIQVWNHLKGKRIRSVSGFQLGISAVAYSPDSTLLAGSSVDGSIRVWRIRTGEVLNSLGLPDKKRVLPDHYPISLGFQPDGWLVSAWHDGEITNWQWQTDDSKPVIATTSNETLTSAAFDMVIGKLVTSTRTGAVDLYDIQASDSGILSTSQTLTVETGEEILSMALSPDGRWLASASYPAGITLWNVQIGYSEKVYARYPLGLQLAASSFSPDSRFLATSHTDGLIRIWDTRNMQQYFEFQPGDGVVSRGLQFSADGNSLLCGSDAIYSFPTENFQHYLRIQQPAFSRTTRVDLLPDWQIETGGVVQTIALSPDQQYLVSANLLDSTISLWDPTKGKLLGTLEKADGPVEVLAFSPDGKTLAAGSIDHKIHFWSLDGDSFTIAEGEESQVIEADRILKNDFAVLTMVYSADGSQMAIAGTNWNVRVVNSLNGGLQVLLKGAKDQIISLAASPGGDLFATGGVDGMIRLYEPGNKNPAAQLRGHAGMVNTLNFSPDKRMLISGGEDGTIRIWGILP
jgi:WD40 repeat protein